MSTHQPKLHPAIRDFQSDLRHGKISRREFLWYATLLGTSVTTAYVMAGCSPPQQAETQPATQLPKRGGTLRIAAPITLLDHPARLQWLENANQVRQVAEYLTETGPDNITRPWLLERWNVDTDVKTWTLHLRQGIQFNNGQSLSADDVIFNMKHWLDPDVGSSVRALMSYLSPTNIERVDDYTIRLYLDEAQIGVPEHLFHYPAVILPRSFEGDFIQQPVGTGPYTMAEFSVGDRIVFKRRHDYWRMGADNQPLPYLDELIYMDLEVDDRVAAMQAGLADTLVFPRPADWKQLNNAPGITIYPVSTARTFVLRMRVDKSPWDDVRVRQALKLCQNRANNLARSYESQGEVAFDAHVAPIHPSFCGKPIPAYDPEQARALLREAGYPSGIQATLVTKNDQAEPQLAELLRESAAAGGFELELEIVEPSRYWEQWTDVALGLTSWAHRPLATMTLALAYTADNDGNPGAWNETHWADPEFMTLLRQAERTLDVEQRRAIMCQLEDIMIERGPIGVSYWRNQWTIVRSEFQNIKSHPTNLDLFYDVWKD